MADKKSVIKGLAHCRQHGTLGGLDCGGIYRYTEDWKIVRTDEHRSGCPYGKCKTGCVVTLVDDAIGLINKQEETISRLEEKLRTLEYGDQDMLNGCLIPAT